MMKRSVFLLALLGIALTAISGPLSESKAIRLTVLYDNYVAAVGMKPDWGFACLIEGAEKTILFDTGTRAQILESNVKALNADLGAIDLIVISHLHGDHAGGLEWALSQKKGIPVYLPAMAGDDYLEKVRGWGGNPVRVKDPVEICANVHLTGEMPADFDPSFTEQSIIFQTSQGLVVLTGCAHPGIVRITKRAPELLPGKPSVVLGGFHLMTKTDAEVDAIIDEMKAAGVVRCGASHCTGDKAIARFKESFSENYIALGVGRILELSW